MIEKIEIKIFDEENRDGFVEKAAELYLQCGFSNFDMNTEALLNSSYFGIAYYNGDPVGIGRVVSDKVHHSLIVDLNIIKEFRGKGCGKALVIALAENAKTRNVFLATDPNNQTLPEFYKKAGFALFEGSQIFRWPS